MTSICLPTVHCYRSLNINVQKAAGHCIQNVTDRRQEADKNVLGHKRQSQSRNTCHRY